jgi:hypothetical protein
MSTSLVATSFVLYDRERREPSHFRRRGGEVSEGMSKLQARFCALAPIIRAAARLQPWREKPFRGRRRIEMSLGPLRPDGM